MALKILDRRVVQVEAREKVRFADDGRQDERGRQVTADGESHRTAGGAVPSGEETNR